MIIAFQGLVTKPHQLLRNRCSKLKELKLYKITPPQEIWLMNLLMSKHPARKDVNTGLPAYVCVVQHVHMNIQFSSIIAIVNI